MKSAKTMYGLEYKSYDGACTFDIFENYKDAEKEAEKTKTLGYQYYPLYIFKADFNLKRIYREENSWNYEDCSDTFDMENIKIIKKFSKNK